MRHTIVILFSLFYAINNCSASTQYQGILWSIENTQDLVLQSSDYKFSITGNTLNFNDSRKKISFKHPVIAVIANRSGRFIAVYTDSDDNIKYLKKDNNNPVTLNEAIGQGVSVDIVDLRKQKKYATEGYWALNFTKESLDIWSPDGKHAAVMMSMYGNINIFSVEKMIKNTPPFYKSVYYSGESCEGASVYDKVHWINSETLAFTTVYCGVEKKHTYHIQQERFISPVSGKTNP